MCLLQWHQERHGLFVAASRYFTGHLQSTNKWITPCVIRSSHMNNMNNVAANVSQLMKVLVRQIISTGQTGIQLVDRKDMPQPMPYKRLYVKHGFWIMDGAAHKFCFSIKGDSGSRFRNLCNTFLLPRPNKTKKSTWRYWKPAPSPKPTNFGWPQTQQFKHLGPG